MGLGLTAGELLMGAGMVGSTVMASQSSSDRGSADIPQPIATESDIGSQLDTKVETFKDTKKEGKTVSKNKLGAKGLQIPLASPSSTTSSASTTGLRV